MIGIILAATKVRWTLLSNDANRHEGAIKFYARVVKHLLRSYETDAVIAKAGEEICNFKQGSLTPWDFSQKL